MENEDVALLDDAKKPWSTPRIIVDDQLVQNTKLNVNSGADGGIFLNNHS